MKISEMRDLPDVDLDTEIAKRRRRAPWATPPSSSSAFPVATRMSTSCPAFLPLSRSSEACETVQ